MLANPQIERMLQKLRRLEKTLEGRLFCPVASIDMKWYLTKERLNRVPEQSLFSPCANGDAWGGTEQYCWFFGNYTPEESLEGKALYLYPKTTGYEAMLWVNGMPKGIFAAKFVEMSHGNHYCDLLTAKAHAGESMAVALEYYAGNYCIGCSPLENEETRSFQYQVESFDVCVKDEEYADFLFDLKILNQMAEALDENSFRRAEIVRALKKVHDLVYYSPEDVDDAEFRAALRAAHPYLKAEIAKKNSDSAPFAGLIGHSHMDTAWLWTQAETIKKCARTYANQLSLMEQYPEYLFVQSSAYHSEMVRRDYPALFERIQEAVKNGRYEPNGGVWVEGDCNIPTGEMMARQFLWGQRYTRKFFNYTADTFWLPDTFGYSAAIPQIMKLSGVKYFLTTKMDWNDTTKFPFDSFLWRGIDGTEVLTHLNKTHIWPDPKSLVEYVVDGKAYGNCLKEKLVTDKRLLSFGFGDGGGGPQFEMLEIARRIGDVDGLPKSGYTTVSGFMQEMERTMTEPSVFSGELYLQLHRGTLTNRHQIKRNNRLAEIALHNLELLTVRSAVEKNEIASGEAINPLTATLLVNQFHDILPGTCIPEAHEQSLRETGKMIEDTTRDAHAIWDKAAENTFTVTNTTSFERADTLYVEYRAGMRVKGDYAEQRVETVEGKVLLAVSGVKIAPYASVTLEWEQGEAAGCSPFILAGDTLETPFATVQFDDCGYLRSVKDKRAGNRELCSPNGYAFNTLLLAEDVPSAWDNWDIDADLEEKFRPVKTLLSREVVADGAVELRIRSVYSLTAKSTVTQDAIFSADSPLIRFETKMDWYDNHRFLKAAFDTALHVNEARHEVQFGYVKRPTTRNNDTEKAQFEVCAHKYSDLSEMRYGVALLNDCKYGVTAHDASLRLSLHKGGARPDYTGDFGAHICTYGFLPHSGGFSTENVVKPAYLMNYHHFVSAGAHENAALLHMDCDNVVVETVKPCEDAEKAFILHLYECEGASADTRLTVPGAKSVEAVNLLEESLDAATAGDSLTLSFRPFEIKGVKVRY